MDGQGLFDAITDSAVLLDKAGRVVNWNAGASSLFGYSKREAIGLSINFIYDRNYAFPKLIQELNSHQKRWQEDTTFIRKNGIKGNCKSYLCPLPLNEQIRLLLYSFIKIPLSIRNSKKNYIMPISIPRGSYTTYSPVFGVEVSC